MAAWCEMWWVARREWKLNIRAEGHNRYRLWQKVWSVWVEFVQLSRNKKEKRKLAYSSNSKRSLRKAWKGWSQYVLIRREKRKVEEQGKRWNVVRMKRTVWRTWMAAFDERKHLSSMNTHALHHWAFQLQKRVLYTWLQCYHERIVLHQGTTVASLHWRRKVIGRSLNLWLAYVHKRRIKHHMRGVASEHHSLVIAQRTFVYWKKRHVRERQLAEFQELVSFKGKSATLRRALSKWKFYITLKRYKHDQKEMASHYYNSVIELKVILTLKEYASLQCRQTHDKQLALQFHTNHLIHHCWVKWLQRCEHCEEIKLGPRTRRARAHFASKVKRAVMSAWLLYWERRVERKRLYSVADQHFKTVALPYCFAAMKMFVSIRQYQKQLKEQSSSFRRETLLSMVFYKWWREAQLSQDVRMLERMAILHNEGVLKNRLLKLWKLRTRERQNQHNSEQVAIAHHYYLLVGTAFQRWKSRYQNTIRLNRQVRIAAEHSDHHLIQSVWAAWTKHIAKKRESRIKAGVAIKHDGAILLKRAMTAWKAFHSDCLAKKAKKLKAVQVYHTNLLRKALAWWREGSEVCKKNQRLLDQATSFNQLSVLRKHFSTWRKKTAAVLAQNQSEEALLCEVHEQLQHLKVVRVFSVWRRHVSRRVAWRLSNDRAHFHHSKVVLGKCLTAWYEYHRLQLRKRLLRRQVVWFENTRLLSLTYSKWRVQLMHAIVMKKKTSEALWHWSQVLEAKVVAAWLLYTMQKKRKRERYSQAMDRHRKRLITIGVKQWIKVASQVQMQREETALQQQLTTTQAAMNSARKCALHWRRVVRERKGNNQTSSRNLVTASLSLQTCPERKSTTMTSDLWNSLARQLRIPDGGCVSRPQPRRSTCSRLSPFSIDNDVIPRVPVHPRPTSPAIVAAATCPTRGDSLPPFHESPCRQTELKEATTVEFRSAALPQCDPLSFQDQNVDRSGRSTGQVTPSLPTQRGSVEERQETGSVEGAQSAKLDGVGYSHSSDGTVEGQRTGTVDLASPQLKMEIVRMRDELKWFHDLKLQHKRLEAQLAAVQSQGDGERATELEEQLRTCSEQIKQYAPVVHDIAAKVKQLLSQS